MPLGKTGNTSRTLWPFRTCRDCCNGIGQTGYFAHRNVADFSIGYRTVLDMAGFDAGAHFMMGVMGVGAIVAFVAMMMFILLVVAAVFFGKSNKETGMVPWQTAEAMANKLLEAGPLAIRAIKQAAIQGLSMPLDDGLRLESNLFRLLAMTEDSVEGTRAFAEKREPEWKAR